MFDFDVRSGSLRPDNLRQEGLRVAALRSENDSGPNDLAALGRLGASGYHFADPITDVPRRPPVVLVPSWTVREAFGLMVERHASVALVASHGVLLGTLSEREIVRRLLESQQAAGDVPVWEAMVSEPETLLETDTVAYAIRKLWTLGGRAMPIVRASGAVFGVLETQDLVSWMCGRVGASPQVRTGHG